MNALATEEKLRNLLETIIRTIAKLDQVEINHYPNEALFTFAVNARDQGRFIGKMGSTIWAIQTLLWFGGLAQCGYSYHVRLLEQKTPIKNQKAPFKFNPKWDRARIKKLLSTILVTCLPLHASCEIHEANETTATVKLTIQKYLERQLSDPNFTEAMQTVVRIAGMSQGVALKTEVIFS